MGKILALLAIATLVAAFLVPYRGLTVFQRVARRVLPSTSESRRQRVAPPPAQVRRDHAVAERPKEKLSDDDRKALDRLVSDSAR
jgi:hypothetical protein